MDINLGTWLLSALPITLFLIMMTFFRWSGSRAGALSWLFTIVVAWAFFGADLTLFGYTYIKAFLLSLDVLLIIWSALFLYRITQEAGTIQMVGNTLARVTSNRSMQAIMMGWIFPSFLQGLGGFGVPVAISAPLLVNAGFSPIQSVMMASIGHSWAVTYGSMASSFQTLMAVTNLPGELLAPTTALLLGIASYACGVLVVTIADGFQSAVKASPAIFLLGTIMATCVYFFSTQGFWTIAVPLSTLITSGIALLLLRKKDEKGHHQSSENQGVKMQDGNQEKVTLTLSLMPYAILVGLSFLINLIKPLYRALDFLKIEVLFPEITTRLGHVTQPEPGRAISFLNHPGMVILTTAFITYFIYKEKGLIRTNGLSKILIKTIDSALQTTIAIFTMVGIAVIMTHTPMTRLLALGLSQVFNQDLYPFISPFIGALGAIITGSNNNSNVLFETVEKQVTKLTD